MRHIKKEKAEIKVISVTEKKNSFFTILLIQNVNFN